MSSIFICTTVTAGILDRKEQKERVREENDGKGLVGIAETSSVLSVSRQLGKSGF